MVPPPPPVDGFDIRHRLPAGCDTDGILPKAAATVRSNGALTAPHSFTVSGRAGALPSRREIVKPCGSDHPPITRRLPDLAAWGARPSPPSRTWRRRGRGR